MKVIDKAYSLIKELPLFWMAYVTSCYALSFNVFYDEWFQDFSVKNFECSTVVLAVFWILAVKEDWNYWSKASLLFLSIITFSDNLYLIQNNLQAYDSIFAIAAYVLAIFYWRYEITKNT